VPHQPADQPLVLALTAAIARAERAMARGLTPTAAEDAVWGGRWVDGGDLGFTTRVDAERPSAPKRPVRSLLRRTARQIEQRMG
jgi:hypothetical protein